ncbi:hypothetical protein BDZ45DRAFT_805312 [Acephala macrosclerotiorum]|nr:hypothetical protein BDZ45DRAFT_805312 [Acephala macrosclerotiorum]
MAEVFGIAAGAAGFVSLLIQVISGIDTLRDIGNRADKAPAELASLTIELTCLKRLMEEVIDKAPCNDDFVLQLCQASCEQVVKGLEKLKKRVPTESEGTGKQKLLKIFTFRHWKEDVEVLQRSIQGAKINLILVNTRHTSVRLEEIMLVNQIHISSPLVSSPEGNIHTTPPLPPTPASYSSDKSNVDSHTIACIQPPKFRNHWNCAERHCSCSCHYTARTTRRFWALEYTPLYVFRQNCDNKSCNGNKYGGKFSFALSQLGIRWSAIIQFHILATPGKFLFRPGFEVERIVPYTSPGFETLWRCQNLLITAEEARDRLVDLYRSDPTFKNHVNPGGISYIEELLRVPWGGPANTLNQYTLLKLFMREFGMTRGTQSARFLARCAKWIREGPHLGLLKILFDLGFDATVIDSPHAQDWPEPFSPGSPTEGLARDPFFVEYQSMLLRDNQGFGKMAPLHEAVLLGSLESVNEWIPRSDKNERNFLGQTPIHLAISNLKHLLALVNAGHDLDAADNYGITPLMYAAAANLEECLIVLLEAGANPILRDTRYKRTFVEYAAVRGHWNLILKSLCWVETVSGKEIAEKWAQYATILYYVVYPDYSAEREVSFQQLLAKCGSVNFTFDHCDKELQNNSLLHYVRSVKDVEVLLEHGFMLVNHANSAGQHALISAAVGRCKPDVVRRLLSAGVEINLRDNLHHTTLYYVLDKLQTAHEDTICAIMDTVRILLANGADALFRDSCRCPCSPNGCLPSTVLKYSACEDFFSTRVPVWSLEWLSLVLEHRGTGEAKTILLSFIRKAKFDEMDMTHVCCSRNRDRFFPELLQKRLISDEDIDEILDEESEFIEILENEMALSSAKVYETLLDDWILQIKASLEKSYEKAMEYNKHLTCKKAPYQTEYLVDYKNDRFITNFNWWSWDKDLVREVTYDIAQYIRWMEHKYHYGSTSRLDMDKSTKDDWYFRRVSWLHRLVNLLEISTAEIADKMRDTWTPNTESKYRPVNVEESIKHFLLSWEIWEERQFPLVGEAEMPLGR